MEILKNLRTLLHHIDINIAELPMPYEKNQHIAYPLFDLTHEHAKAINLLLEHDPSLPGSAYALMRPLLESFIRGYWLLHYADDDKTKRFINGELDLPIASLVRKISKRLPTLKSFPQDVINRMHDFAHGGMRQISIRFQKDYIEAKVDDESINRDLKIVGNLSLLAFYEAIDLARISGDEKEKRVREVEKYALWILEK